MGLKKDIQLANGGIYSYHAVYQFSFDSTGGCLAEIGSYQDEHSALIKRKPDVVYPVRCDGITATADVIQQIYCVVASDPYFAGAEAFSEEAAYGLANPKVALPVKPEAPTAYHVWDEASWSWILDAEGLAILKDQAKQRITLARNAAERAGFEAFGKVFDSDDKAIQRIYVAAQAAMIAKAQEVPFSIEWTLMDNSTLQLTAEQMIQLPLIMSAASSQLHSKARSLKALIDTAVTLEEIDSVQW